MAEYRREDNDFSNIEGGDSDDDISDDDFQLPPPQTLRGIRNDLETQRFADYLEKFDDYAEREAVTFTTLPSSVVDERQRAALLALGIEREDEEMQHQNDLDHIELLKKRRMFELQRRADNQRASHKRSIKEIALKASLTGELLGTFFEHTKQQLTLHLTSRRAEVLQSIGEVRKFERGDNDPEKPDWSTFEQQVELNIQMLRGVKDKLPKGEYMMLVSKWDKMAGDPMRWSTRKYHARHPPPCSLHQEEKDITIRSKCEICQGWAGGTMPVSHSGNPTEYEMKFDSKTFTFFPSEHNIKPYMALMFELVLLPKDRHGAPKIVGWGALPCVDSSFQIINGKFRFPMLRGEYRPEFMHHKTIAKHISDDIENWLCNCYIDIFPHHREHYGRDEFRLQNEYTAKLLGLDEDLYPVKIDDRDGWLVEEGRPRGNSFRIQQEHLIEKADMQLGMAALDDVKLDAQELTQQAGSINLGVVFGGESSGFGEELDAIDPDFPYTRPETWDLEETAALSYWAMIRQAVKNKAQERRGDEMERQRRLVEEAEKKKAYRFSIHPSGAVLLHSAWQVQVVYSKRAILDEMSIRKGPLDWKFWLNLIAGLAATLFQVYAHSCIKYVACLILGTPIDSTVPRGYGLIVQYSLLNTTALEELFVCFLAQLGNFLAVGLLMLFGAVMKKTAGSVPEHLSKFVYALAVGDLLVPWICLFIDLGNDSTQGDILRLHQFFTIHDYGAFYGYIIFILVYVFFLCIIYVSIFLYTMRLHLNGILQDAYWRILLVNEDSFFIPEDLEVSRRELFYILEKAEQWRGKNGERKKIAAHHMTTTDEEIEGFKAMSEYITIKTLKCGDAEAYRNAILDVPDHPDFVVPFRQFYVMSDGAILETLKEDLPVGMAFVLAKMDKRYVIGTGNFNPIMAMMSLGGLAAGFGQGKRDVMEMSKLNTSNNTKTNSGVVAPPPNNLANWGFGS